MQHVVCEHARRSPLRYLRVVFRGWTATKTCGAFRDITPANYPIFNAVSQARLLHLHAALVAEQQAEWA
jgi:protocatechuate 3,4-dioxygenase beta subunit